MSAGDIDYEFSLWVKSGTANASITAGDIVYNGGDGWIPADGSYSGQPIGVANADADSASSFAIIRSGVVSVAKATGTATVDGTEVDLTSGEVEEGGTTTPNAFVVEATASDAEEVQIYLV